MTTEQINNELAKENLRLAASDEAGWYWSIYDEENETVITVWITEIRKVK